MSSARPDPTSAHAIVPVKSERPLVALKADLRQADVIIRPETVRTRMLDFTAKLQNMAAGEAAAGNMSARIGEMIADSARRKASRSVQAAPAS